MDRKREREKVSERMDRKRERERKSQERDMQETNSSVEKCCNFASRANHKEGKKGSICI